MRLDHFVVHVDGPEQLSRLKSKCETAGFPLDLRHGKGTSGFKANYLWVGDEYFEIVWLKNPDGGGWQQDWVNLYNAGRRGLFCVFIEADNLDRVQADLKSRFVPGHIEQTIFRVCFGLLKVTMPWRYLVLPKIPGTDIQLNFFEYSPGAKDKFRPRMKPNSKQNGISGIRDARIALPQWAQAIAFLMSIFPSLKIEDYIATIKLNDGRILFEPSQNGLAQVYFEAKSSNPAFCGKSFSLENANVIVGR